MTPICLLLALVSAGAGHGDYVLARVLYPYSLLLTRLTGSLSMPFVILAVAQFPAYGWLFGMARSRGTKWHIAAIAIHIVSVLITFSGVLPDFS